MSGKEHHRASHTPTLTVTAFTARAKLWRLARRIGAGGHNPQKSRRRNALWRPLPAATAAYARRTQWHFDRDREFRARVLRSNSMIRARWTHILKAGISKSTFKKIVYGDNAALPRWIIP